jgi:phosphatidylglycerophosphatase C
MDTEVLQPAPSVAGGDAPAPRVVLFDFDGVLVHGDTFHLFMRDRYARAGWRKALAALALPWLLLRLPFSWRASLRSLVHIGLCGLDERRYREAVAQFAAALARRPRQFCRDGLRQLRLHQADGDRVLVVTGCEETLARAVLAELGLDGLEVVASALRPGWSGMRVARHNVGRRKAEALAALGITAGATAYSDSNQDIPMLKLAAAPVLVNATPAICKRVERALGRSVARVEWY